MNGAIGLQRHLLYFEVGIELMQNLRIMGSLVHLLCSDFFSVMLSTIFFFRIVVPDLLSFSFTEFAFCWLNFNFVR